MKWLAILSIGLLGCGLLVILFGAWALIQDERDRRTDELASLLEREP